MVTNIFKTINHLTSNSLYTNKKEWKWHNALEEAQKCGQSMYWIQSGNVDKACIESSQVKTSQYSEYLLFLLTST